MTKTMNKLFQRLLKAKNKIATCVAPIVLLYYFDDKIQLRDRIYYFFIAFFKSIPLLMLYSYFSAWKDKNEFFYAGICTALLLNALVGGVYHFYAGTFDIRKFLVKNAEMLFIIAVVYISLSLLSIPLDESEIGVLFKRAIQLATLLYPVSKILKNSFILTNGKFPPKFVMKALYNYEREGKLKDFFDDISKGAKDLTIDNHERKTTTDSEEQ